MEGPLDALEVVSVLFLPFLDTPYLNRIGLANIEDTLQYILDSGAPAFELA